MVGDILHSRVARSGIWGLLKLGAKPGVAGPATLIPPGLEEFGVKVYSSIEEAIEDADVLNVLRIQRERQSESFFPGMREYFEAFGITGKRLLSTKKDIVIMHPGPMNRGVEIESEVADGPWSVILNQVTNGVAVRMAVLYLLNGGSVSMS
jgi:aspartate carbamoyltransferase catalytic subunit